MKRVKSYETTEDHALKKLKQHDEEQEKLISLLPYEMKLYILEFINFPLSRYLIVSEFDEHSLGLNDDHHTYDVSSQEKVWAHTRRMARKQLIKLMFGYFVSEKEGRTIFLLFKHVDYNFRGIFGQYGLYTELRFKDLKSIQFTTNYTYACKYFDFKMYLPNLESISGLNIESDDDANDFLAHDLSKLTSLSFSDAERAVIPESVGFEKVFSKLTNITSLNIGLERDVSFLKHLKHLKIAKFTESNLTEKSLQKLLEQNECLEELNISYPNDDIELDNVFSKLKKPIKLAKFCALGISVNEEFLENLVKASRYLPNLRDLGISPYELDNADLWRDFFNSFPQLKSLDFEDQTLTVDIMAHIHVLKELRSLKSNLETTSGLELLPQLTHLSISCLNDTLDFSKLDRLETLSIGAYYGSIISSFEDVNTLPALKRIRINLGSADYKKKIDDIIQITQKRPNIRYSVEAVEGFDQVNFEKILSCPSIDELTCSKTPIPNSIENNTSLKSLTIHYDFDNLKLFYNNQTLETLNLYTTDCMDCMKTEDICDFFRHCPVQQISFVDPMICGPLDF